MARPVPELGAMSGISGAPSRPMGSRSSVRFLVHKSFCQARSAICAVSTITEAHDFIVASSAN